MNIKQVTKLTGLTSKTLRHWESVGLLSPSRADNDYRNYTDNDLNQIFYIMSLRQLDVPLEKIREILSAQIDEKTALTTHLSVLTERQNTLSALIKHLSAKLEKGDYQMSKKDFVLFKQQQLEENEKNYGTEIRQKYGQQTIEKSNQKFLNQNEAEFSWAKETHEKIINMLEKAYADNDEQLAFEAVKLHKRWLEFYWEDHTVTPKAHIGLTQMYCDDERFRKNYTQKYDGLPEFFLNATINFYNK